jgi:hypothetical protein
MSSRYLKMWALISLLGLGAAFELVKYGNPFGSIFDAFPSDLSQQEALRRCDNMSTNFAIFCARSRNVLPHDDSCRDGDGSAERLLMQPSLNGTEALHPRVRPGWVAGFPLDSPPPFPDRFQPDEIEHQPAEIE